MLVCQTEGADICLYTDMHMLLFSLKHHAISFRCAEFPAGTPSWTFWRSAGRSWAWLMRTYPPSWHTINYSTLGLLLPAMQLKSTRCMTSGFLRYFPESKSKSTRPHPFWPTGEEYHLWSFDPFLLFCSHSCLEWTLSCFTLPGFFCPPTPSDCWPRPN